MNTEQLQDEIDFLNRELDTVCEAIAHYCIINNIDVDGGDEVYWFINQFRIEETDSS